MTLRLLALTLALLPTSALALGDHIRSTPTPSSFPIATPTHATPILISPADYPGVIRAAHSLAADITSVTTQTPTFPTTPTGEIILIGTLGHSPLIDRLASAHKLDVTPIQSRWETSITQVVLNPLPDVPRALVLAGADKRGTIFAIYDLSQQIGVSPWAWWADVPIPHQSALYITPGPFLQPEPAVKYRGIFLNDEAPALTGWAQEKFGGLNSRFYTHVFELLLRLKANFLWPAMWGNAFNEDDPADPALADEYGIVMSTSHHEPMMRAQQEWKRHGTGPWDYSTNSKVLQDFWREGVRRNRTYEQLTTIGMRGDGDMAMSPGTNTALLERIVADQRKILTQEVNPDITKIPQVWALYKEVQDYYEAGMRVPDDVTLLWCDDNWGNLRRLPTPEERKRPGGAGIYYHFDYVGDPRNYKWLNTVPITKIWEQMNLAVQYDATRVWIVNVGDLKPLEFPIEFFLTMARTPSRFAPQPNRDVLQDYTEDWAAQNFGPQHAPEIATLLSEYTKFNGRRKPEQIDPSTFQDQDEADRILAEYKSTVSRAETLSLQLPPEYRDAFFELVLWPAKASETVLEMNILAGRNHLYAKQGRTSTNDLATQVRNLFTQDATLTAQYNAIHHGKWNHMADQTHLGYFNWQEPPLNIMPPISTVDPKPGPVMSIATQASAAPLEPATIPRFDPFTARTHSVDIFNSGSSPFNWTASVSDSWLLLDRTSGDLTSTTQESRLTLAIDWPQLPPGDHTATLTIAQTANGKPGPRRTFPITVSNPAIPPAFHGFIESAGTLSINAEHFTTQHPSTSASWQLLPGYGETLSAMTVLPATAPSTPTPANQACLDYSIYLFIPGPHTLQTILAPSLPFVPGRGLRYAIALDDAPPQIIDAWASNTFTDWATAVSDGVHKISTTLTIPTPGPHTLHVCSVDPAVVLEKLVLTVTPPPSPHNPKDPPQLPALPQPYLGPPESTHR